MCLRSLNILVNLLLSPLSSPSPLPFLSSFLFTHPSLTPILPFSFSSPLHILNNTPWFLDTEFGGVWSKSRAYQNLCTNNTKYTFSFSDMPIPDHYDEYYPIPSSFSSITLLSPLPSPLFFSLLLFPCLHYNIGTLQQHKCLNTSQHMRTNIACSHMWPLTLRWCVLLKQVCQREREEGGGRREERGRGGEGREESDERKGEIREVLIIGFL